MLSLLVMVPARRAGPKRTQPLLRVDVAVGPGTGRSPRASVIHTGAMTTDPVDVLARALQQVGALITQVRPDQASLPTPCQSWDVTALLDHILADMPRFVESARGGRPDYSSTSPSVAPNWAPEFTARSDELVRAWRDARDPARLDASEAPREFQEMQIAEMAVHAWDLATAIGLASDLDPELAEYSADWMGSVLAPQYRGSEADGKVFGLLVEVSADVPAYSRLVAISGRDPSWSTPK